jgi:uncharacterized membrane protein
MTEPNPYAPPRTEVRDMPAGSALDGDRFNPEGRSCPASSGWRWYGTAWRLFKAQPFAWWGALVIAFGAIMPLSFVPLLNLLTSIAFPIAAAGLGACAHSLIKEGRFEIGQVFDGLKRRPGALLMAGLAYLLFMVLSMGVALLFSAGSFGAIFLGNLQERQIAMQQVFTAGGFVILSYLTLMSVALSAIVFAPYLIHEQNMPVQQAMLTSLKACFKNIPAMLVWMLSYIFWAILATIPLGLGWLVLLPVLFITGYIGYRDIFHEST